MPLTNGAVLPMPFRHKNDGESQVPVVALEAGAIMVDLGDTTLNVDESEGVDSLENQLPTSFGSYPQVLAYTSGKLTSISVTVPAQGTWVQTLSYTGDDLTGVSMWVKQ